MRREICPPAIFGNVLIRINVCATHISLISSGPTIALTVSRLYVEVALEVAAWVNAHAAFLTFDLPANCACLFSDFVSSTRV
jgi:hypothetical protein